jgi:pimeloyl-ACP methyl ester carboxylesterase
MAEAQVNGITIHYDEQGEGEPMLLIMGLATQLIAWPPRLLDALSAHGFRVVRFDNRDIGLSHKHHESIPQRADVLRGLASGRLARSHYLLADMAADAAGLLDHLGIDSAHVVGVSMGGMIAQELTLEHPDRVRSLCSIMSNTGDRIHGRPAPSIMPGLGRSMVAKRPTDRDAAIALGVETWRQISGPGFDEEEIRGLVTMAVERDPEPYGRIRQLLAIQASPDRTRRLRDVTAPTLVIHGLLDRLVSPSGGMATARAIPGSRLLMFPDMAHDLPRGRIGEIADAIAENAARARADRTEAQAS